MEHWFPFWIKIFFKQTAHLWGHKWSSSWQWISLWGLRIEIEFSSKLLPPADVEFYIPSYLEVTAIKILNLVLSELAACRHADSQAPLLAILVQEVGAGAQEYEPSSNTLGHWDAGDIWTTVSENPFQGFWFVFCFSLCYIKANFY